MLTATTKDAYKLLHQSSEVMARIEHNGIRIDTDYLETAIKETTDKIRSLERELSTDEVYVRMQKKYGGRANMGSTQQIGDVLFGDMGYECKNKTATGKPSTDEESLSKVDHPFVKTYLRWKKLQKALGTYLKGFQAETVDGFMHPSFDLNTAVSYRSNSSNPNFQNIPVRDSEIMLLIRRCFVPRKGRRLVETDFGGIEVRAGCCYHKDPTMIRYLTDPTSDMHADTACELFFMTRDQVKENKKTVRHWAKNQFVFPQFYGSVYFQCAPHLWAEVDKINPMIGNVSLKKNLKRNGIRGLGDCDPKGNPTPDTFVYHCKKIQESFWGKRFRKYDRWKRDTYDFYLRNGYVELLSGFRCTHSRDGLLKRNDATNYPIQGLAFHWLLWTIIQVQKHLTKHKWKTKLVGQIHDSIIADVYEPELQDYLSLIHDVITRRLPKHWEWINVPLEVEMEVCPTNASWDTKKSWNMVDGLWQAA